MNAIDLERDRRLRHRLDVAERKIKRLTAHAEKLRDKWIDAKADLTRLRAALAYLAITKDPP